MDRQEQRALKSSFCDSFAVGAGFAVVAVGGAVVVLVGAGVCFLVRPRTISKSSSGYLGILLHSS